MAEVRTPEPPKLVIRQSRPWLWPVISIAIVAGWVLVAWSTFLWVRDTVAADHAQRVEEIGQLRIEVAELKEEKERLKRATAVAQREAQVSSTVEEDLRQLLVDKEQELSDVREELAFYERLVGSSGRREGLSVHDLEMTPTDASNVFAFRMTLLQNIQRASVVSGELTLRVEAISDSGLVSRTPSRILVEGQEGPLTFQFKYFQQLEGLLEMPDDAQIQAIVVEMKPRRGSTVTRRFEIGDTIAAHTRGS